MCRTSWSLAVRTSETKGAVTSKFGDTSGLGAGFGFKVFGYNVDYAWIPFGELGNIHRISLGARF